MIYPSGRHIVTLDIVKKKSEFIKREHTDLTTLTAMACGYTKRKELLVALGEKTRGNNGVPHVTAYIPSRLRWMNMKHDHLPFTNETSEVVQLIVSKRVSLCIGSANTCV